MDGTEGYYDKQNKLIAERQLCDFTHTEGVSTKTEDHKGREGQIGQKQMEMLNYRKQTEGHWRGGEWGDALRRAQME